ncbi:MAG: D-tyrosyl-tRNA(Tyr) deacylase [Candidatus Syntrophonatronum acetioxidans]|uniref:D-aminoacyl-tRNA deacylase n=1 Tax=Candidatus Syntrophonatronum acetioxidans TaxID=1795816 RepID=A0A424YIN8_9FIRM|nr:MAG: D-tyrosyl-tRNA(Tyr) deacylase [Candidatus Syntrophonatronum acetioxidans]
MRAVVQRVKRGKVTVNDSSVGSINKGVVVLLGVGKQDDIDEAKYMADKITNLRIFEDEEGKMNLSLKDIEGEALIVSQFTLYGDCRKGRRPSFYDAAPPEKAEELYQKFCELVQEKGIKVEQGEFQTMMVVEIINDGPVTILLDSGKTF